jgi:dienelactone hydrolase
MNESRAARAAAAGLLSLALGVAAAAEPPLVPVKDFARKPAFERAKISPSGEYLAVSTPVGDQTSLAIIGLKDRKITGGIQFRTGEHVHDFWWVGPERVVLTVAEKRGPLDQPRFLGELYALNADNSRRAYLYGYRGSEQVGSNLRVATKAFGWAWMLDPLPHDPLRALITIVPWERGKDGDNPLIESIDVYTGRRSRVSVVAGYPPIEAVADVGGRLRFATSRDDQARVQLFAAAGANRGWHKLELPGGAPETIDLHGSSPDGNSVYLTTEDATGRSCLREYRFGAGFRDVHCVDHDTLGHVLQGLEDRKPFGIARGQAAPVTEYFDKEHPDARFDRSLRKAFGNQHLYLTSHTLDGKSAVAFIESGRNPGDFYRIDRQTRKAEYLVSRREWIDPHAMAPVESVQYRTRDGATIYGYLTARNGIGTRNAPLVVMPHGGPHGVFDRWEFDAWAQLLASRGYAVLQPNYRGSGGYGKAHERAGYRKWGTLMQDDLTDAARWAIEAGIADKNRLCIFGASYGGYAALMSPLREPDLYRCAIGFAGVYDLVEQAADSDIAEGTMGRKYLERVLGDVATMREQSPVAHIAKLKIPVLIAHGTADKRVPFSQAKLLRKALEQHQKTYEWMEFKGEEHGLYDDANHEAFLTRVLEFLDKNIGAGGAGAAPG